ncbi:MAG: hypothetical protein NUV77_24765, partial [Thermoguttaceae bacterium]|nr:hypothetical protein [Thermoguttaceae bacterium]
HAPHADRRLTVADADENPLAGVRMLATRYVWEGDVRPGKPIQFVQVLLPHAPTRDASPLAAAIRCLADEPGVAAVSLSEGSRREVAILNPAGRSLTLALPEGELATDAKAAYVDFDRGKPARTEARGETFLRIGLPAGSGRTGR